MDIGGFSHTDISHNCFDLCLGGCGGEGRQNSSSQPSNIYEPVRVTESDFSLSLKRKYLTDQLSHLNLNSANREPILNLAIDEYIAWRDEPVYLIFKEHIAYNTRYRAVRASRRGNPVHKWRLKKRFRGMNKLFPDIDLTKSAHSFATTNILFATLSYGDRQNKTIGECWTQLSKDYNKFCAWLRKRNGRIAFIKGYSAHKDGYPHIHVILIFDKKWPIKRHLDRDGGVSWRLAHYGVKKQEFERIWGQGWVDIKAVTNPRYAINYIVGYITGEHQNNNLLDDLSLSLSYLYRKRSFSISSLDTITLCITQTPISQPARPDRILDPFFSNFYHIELLRMVKMDFADRPPPFSIDLDKSEGLLQQILSINKI